MTPSPGKKSGSKAAKPAAKPAKFPALAKVLVPTDLSPASLSVLPYAASLASRFGGEILVVYLVDEAGTAIHQSHGYTTAEAVRAGVVKAARERLAEAAPSLALDGVKVETAVDVVDSIPDAIAAFAKRHGADVIVMGTHARTGLAHFFGGSVTEATLRVADRPVLTVRVA